MYELRLKVNGGTLGESFLQDVRSRSGQAFRAESNRDGTRQGKMANAMRGGPRRKREEAWMRREWAVGLTPRVELPGYWRQSFQ